jgi:hypothetical protein
MGRKNIFAASIAAAVPFALVNHVGYQGHCEIKPEQCLQNAPDQLHIEHHAPAFASNGIPSNTVAPGSGSLSLSADARGVATATADLTTGPRDYLMTESGNYITTENGNFMVT